MEASGLGKYTLARLPAYRPEAPSSRRGRLPFLRRPLGVFGGRFERVHPLARQHTALTCESSRRRVSTAGTHSTRLRPRSGSRSLFGSREGNERCVRAPTCSDDDELLPRPRPVGHRVPVSGKWRRATPEFSTGLLVVRIQV